jgi:predicted enzyme related to lactoylglutathione lyase
MATRQITWWHELNTSKPDEAMAFYATTLGWSFEGMTLPDGAPYWIARRNGRPVAGVFRLNEGHEDVPSHWMAYLAVPEMSAAESAAVAAGGAVVRRPVALAGIGTLCVVTDPDGAMVGLIEPDPGHALAEAA